MKMSGYGWKTNGVWLFCTSVCDDMPDSVKKMAEKGQEAVMSEEVLLPLSVDTPLCNICNEHFYTRNAYFTICLSCQGTGRCPHCERPCEICDGSGRVQCSCGNTSEPVTMAGVCVDLRVVHRALAEAEVDEPVRVLVGSVGRTAIVMFVGGYYIFVARYDENVKVNV